MLISRGLSIVKTLNKLQNNNVQFKQLIRNSHAPWNYGVPSPPAPKKIVLIAELVQGFAWWWVLWHIWTEPGHIIGEFAYPDARKWTDEELGIPPS